MLLLSRVRLVCFPDFSSGGILRTQKLTSPSSVKNPELPPSASSSSSPRCGVLRKQKLNIYLLRTQRSKVLPLSPGVGQNIAMHASPAARGFFLELMSIFLVHSPSFFFFQNLSQVFPLLPVANAASCVGRQNKIGLPTRYRRRLMQVSVLSAYGI